VGVAYLQRLDWRSDKYTEEQKDGLRSAFFFVGSPLNLLRYAVYLARIADSNRGSPHIRTSQLSAAKTLRRRLHSPVKKLQRSKRKVFIVLSRPLLSGVVSETILNQYNDGLLRPHDS
jgi:hypothetical protein